MQAYRSMVLVSGDPKSLALGAQAVYERIQDEVKALGMQDEISILLTGDVGKSDALPLVVIYPEATIYGPVSVEDVPYLVEEHLYKGRIAHNLTVDVRLQSGKTAWLSARKGTMPAEHRIVLERAGLIDPESIEDYILHDGYMAIAKMLQEMSPEQVLQELQDSGLRGRGGAGFPTGLKWKFVAKANGSKKYVVCNADESEPGTFKDRQILEGDPHLILEAMAVAGYAVGADEGYIYVRGEYALAQQRLLRAIEQAEEMGFLGENIFGTQFSFKIRIHSGAGAYICGEETALLESLEGKRGEPRSRPPYPTTHGLFGKPTLVNNVETLANVPAIIVHGAQWYHNIGTASSPGTKCYTILGNVNQTGLIEVPMGITLREVIAIYAKGMQPGSQLKLAQTGGSSGSIVPASLQDTPMDFDSYAKASVSLGSGALLICDQETCVVDLARVLMNFFRNESCGKCNPCRIATQRSYEILERISMGKGTLEDIDKLEDMSSNLFEMSNCGLGQTAATPMRDILIHFRAEVEAHVRLGVCPSGVCPMHEPVASLVYG
jgi:NADP-reducing hydrogenase subunit HndC